ncbi:hypothetical protein PInf_017528 [Phytophthora infestans]|nr:hypothetical protein PInf_017528 [Phytophthora infestans]
MVDDSDLEDKAPIPLIAKGFGNPAGCEIVAAGSIADQNQLKSTYWLFELVCSILRWETACVAPLFLKQI